MSEAARQEAFAHIKQSTTAALEHPDVIRRLGDTSAALLDLLEDSYCVPIVGGAFAVPPEQLNRNSVGVHPHLTEGDLPYPHYYHDTPPPGHIRQSKYRLADPTTNPIGPPYPDLAAATNLFHYQLYHFNPRSGEWGQRNLVVAGKVALVPGAGLFLGTSVAHELHHVDSRRQDKLTESPEFLTAEQAADKSTQSERGAYIVTDAVATTFEVIPEGAFTMSALARSIDDLEPVEGGTALHERIKTYGSESKLRDPAKLSFLYSALWARASAALTTVYGDGRHEEPTAEETQAYLAAGIVVKIAK